MNKVLLTVSKKFYILAKIFYATIGFILSLTLICTVLFGSVKNPTGNSFINYTIAVSVLFFFSFVDYYIILTLFRTKMIYYNNFGLLAGSKAIAWEKIHNVKITSGQSPLLKVTFEKNKKMETVYGILKVWPTKKYLESIQEIFQQFGVEVRESFF